MISSPTLYRNLENFSRFAAFSHHDLTSFRTAKLGNGVHSVVFEGTPIDMLIMPRPGKPLFVTLNGNSPRGPASVPPFFSGLGVAPKDRLVSFVSISDPVLAESETLSLAWYGGSRRIALQQKLPELLDALQENLQPSKILFFGGSGGGFASLRAASMIPGSGAIVWNPQTDIREYDQSAVIQYAATSWDESVQDIAAARDVLTRNLDPILTDNFADSCARALYFQNANDWHVIKHMRPFLARNGYLVPDTQFSGRVGRGCYLHYADWGIGHAPVPKYALTSILRELLVADGAFWHDDDDAIAQMIEQAFIPPVVEEELAP